MRRFMIKGTLMLLPIILVHLFCLLFYSTSKGDLFRIGYVFDSGEYDRNDIFKKEFLEKIMYTQVSEINMNAPNKFTLLTIGDSFSEQQGSGYINYLAKNKKISVLHFDRFLHDNPIESLHALLKGDFFNQIKVDYIILQSVERQFVDRSNEIDTTKVILIDSLIEKTKKFKPVHTTVSYPYNFFSDRIFKFLLYTIYYRFDDNAFFSETYRVKTTKNFFSVNKKELLFVSEELDNIEINNNIDSINKLNNELNYLSAKLNEKSITLIVLPCPDKLDIYYDYIVNNKYPKQFFFNYMQQMPKQYLFINSKQIIQNALDSTKDLYFYDDTHWSPLASQLIANTLAETISH